MSAQDLLPVAALTVDQRGSRRGVDRVPGLLAALEGADTLLAFERTAGDEIQGVVATADAFTDVMARLLRSPGWSIGVGLGGIERPLPSSTRAATGPAYLAAREAVERAKGASRAIRVVGAPEYGAGTEAAPLLEDALWLWATIAERRTEKGWQVVELVAGGLSHQAAADRLGISQSAVTQRASAAAAAEEGRARRLVTWLASRALGSPSTGACDG